MNQYVKKIVEIVSKKIATPIGYLPFLNTVFLRGNKLSINGKMMLHCKINCKGHNNKIHLGDGGFLHNTVIHIDGDNNSVCIGDNVSIENGVLWIEDSNNAISIGDYTSICGRTQFACIEGTRIDIGQDCLFSSDITLRTGDSHSILDLEGNRINTSKDIHIGNHVWIGNCAKINKGVSISDNTVVGTGSILTKSIDESNVIIAGVPAKIVKRNINWDRYRILVEKNK